jgi:hypothetical protein
MFLGSGKLMHRPFPLMLLANSADVSLALGVLHSKGGEFPRPKAHAASRS